MLGKKYLDFRKRILVYAISFLFLAALLMLVALIQNLGKSPIFLPVSDLNYIVKTTAATYDVSATVGVVSPGGSSKRAFSFPLMLPEDAELITGSVNVLSTLRAGNPELVDGMIKWKGYMPHKGERSTWKIVYSYRMALSKVKLPLNKLGTFTIKDTPLNILVIVDSKIRAFSCNYSMRSKIKGFTTTLIHESEMVGGEEPLYLSW